MSLVSGLRGVLCGAHQEASMSFGLYLLGFIIVIAGLAWGAVTVGVSPVWVGIGALILLGIGIFSGVTRTRQKDPVE